MKILFDTNIVLDLLLERQPFVNDAQLLFEKVESGQLNGFLGATTVTTLDYLLSKSLSMRDAKVVIKKLLSLFDVAPVNRLVLEDALESGFSDFEDAVLHAAAMHNGAQAIVTRDAKGFSKAKLPIYSPHELLSAI